MITVNMLEPGNPYLDSDESWDEFADHQLDHDPTPLQAQICQVCGQHPSTRAGTEAACRMLADCAIRVPRDAPPRIGLVHAE